MELVKLENGNIVTNTLLVAEKFGKEHRNVLASIKDLAAEKSAAKFFVETTYENRGKDYPMYVMNRDGFSLLVMGFTGEDALKFKIEFIEKFNEMESKLKGQYPQLPTDFLSALKLLTHEVEEKMIVQQALQESEQQRLIAQEEVKRLELPAQITFEIVDDTGLHDMKEVAKALRLIDNKGNEVGRNNFFKLLRHHKILMSNNEPYQQYSKYFEVKYKNTDYGVKSVTFVNARGVAWLTKLKIDGIYNLNILDVVTKNNTVEPNNIF